MDEQSSGQLRQSVPAGLSWLLDGPERTIPARRAAGSGSGIGGPAAMPGPDVARHARGIRLISVLEHALQTAMSILHADRGTIQVADPATGSLRIAVQAGFGDEFLQHFAVVDDGGAVCGRAARRRAQVVTADVMADPAFAPHRETAAASDFRAVQSTPLIDVSGSIRGVVSTHYPQPHRPRPSDLELMRRFGLLIGDVMGASWQPSSLATGSRAAAGT